MQIHNAVLRGAGATIETDPTDPRHAVPLAVLQTMVASGLFVTNVVPLNEENLVGLKAYIPNSVPADFYLTNATTNTTTVRVFFTAEPTNVGFGISVTSTDINGLVTALTENITADVNNPRVYQGFIDLELDGEDIDQDITIESSAGGSYTFNLAVLIGGPTVDSVTIASIPDGQTAVKQGDQIGISGVVGNDALEVFALASGASNAKVQLNLGALDSAGEGKRSFTGTVIASNRSGSQVVGVYGTNILGTEGDVTASAGVTMDQTYPSIANPAYAFPAGQTAIKGSESVTVTSVVANHSSVVYSVASGLSIDNPSAYSADKVVTRVDETIQYDVSSNKMTVVATRASNGAVTTKNMQIDVAAVAMVVTASVVGNPATLASSPTGNSYTVQLDSTQEFLNSPDSFSATAATFVGNWTKVNNTRYRHAIDIEDGMARGAHQFTDGLFTNRAGIETIVITNPEYTIGGFIERDITFAAGEQMAPIGTDVYVINNTVATYKGADTLTLQNTTAQAVRGYSIVDVNGDYDVNGGYLLISDADFAAANTTGTLVLTIAEGV